MTEPADNQTPVRYVDPEKGWRGAISGTLILEALTVLLSIPVARNTGGGTGTGGVIAIVVLAFALIGACAFVKKPWMPWMVAGLQALTIAGWAISAPLGIMGIVFSLVFALVFYMRHEYRRRLAAGQLPWQQFEQDRRTDSDQP